MLYGLDIGGTKIELACSILSWKNNIPNVWKHRKAVMKIG